MKNPDRKIIHAVEVIPRAVYRYCEDDVQVVIYSPNNGITNAAANWYLDRAKLRLLDGA